MRNPCLAPSLPDDLAQHPAVTAALSDLDRDKIWDCHVHLVGTGNTDPEQLWVNPAMDRLWHPFQYLQKRVYMNAACVTDPGRGDQAYIERFSALVEAAGIGKPMLLAFDHNYDTQGRRRPALSTLFVSNHYTRDVAAAHPGWEWICSVHPYRDDAIDAKTRSMMNLAMLGALGKMHEWEIHCRGALRNGVSKEEIRAIVHVVAIYCGVPQAHECFRVARKVLDEAGEG